MGQVRGTRLINRQPDKRDRKGFSPSYERKALGPQRAVT